MWLSVAKVYQCVIFFAVQKIIEVTITIYYLTLYNVYLRIFNKNDFKYF